MATYALSVCFCAARCRSSRAPSSSSSLFLSEEPSYLLPRCGGAPWCPWVLLWLSPSPLRPPVAAQPPPSASPPPVTKKTKPMLTSRGLAGRVMLEEQQSSHLFFSLVVVLHKGVDYLLQFIWLNKRLCVRLDPFWHKTKQHEWIIRDWVEYFWSSRTLFKL